MEVFQWIRHVLATTTPSIEFESILVVLVKYGVTSDQTASGIPLPHKLFQIYGLLQLDSRPSYRLVWRSSDPNPLGHFRGHIPTCIIVCIDTHMCNTQMLMCMYIFIFV